MVPVRTHTALGCSPTPAIPLLHLGSGVALPRSCNGLVKRRLWRHLLSVGRGQLPSHRRSPGGV